MEPCNFTLVVPSLDPDEKLIATIQSAIDAGIDDILLVDDGSQPECRHYFTQLSQLSQVTLLTHPENLGKGAALKTAFSYFLENRKGRAGVVTADGDGQHSMEDVVACAREMVREPHAVVLGCRDFTLDNVPKRSRAGNTITRTVFRIFCGMTLSDTQTGLRAIPAEFLPQLLAVKGTRYEYETNMLLEINRLGIPLREHTIHTIYFDENRESHFRTVRDAARVYALILKYAASSILSSLLDLFFFFLFGVLFFHEGTALDVFLNTASARVLSSGFNFLINRKVVFESEGHMVRSLVRYICLAAVIMTASAFFVNLLSTLFRIQSAPVRTLVKIPVDILLFLVNFRVQRMWVFSGTEKTGGRR